MSTFASEAKKTLGKVIVKGQVADYAKGLAALQDLNDCELAVILLEIAALFDSKYDYVVRSATK